MIRSCSKKPIGDYYLHLKKGGKTANTGSKIPDSWDPVLSSFSAHAAIPTGCELNQCWKLDRIMPLVSTQFYNRVLEVVQTQKDGERFGCMDIFKILLRVLCVDQGGGNWLYRYFLEAAFKLYSQFTPFCCMFAFLDPQSATQQEFLQIP